MPIFCKVVKRWHRYFQSEFSYAVFLCLKKYHRARCYETSNRKVATVTKSGRIKVVGKGNCNGFREFLLDLCIALEYNGFMQCMIGGNI